MYKVLLSANQTQTLDQQNFPIMSQKNTSLPQHLVVWHRKMFMESLLSLVSANFAHLFLVALLDFSVDSVNMTCQCFWYTLF